ncbi:MAG TPA: outer membrane beta-barrel protein [Gemmatimonadaceae bacterium]|nr:outer membrane beta-barrel protein [Gemmatimonadaceae bacterium]
MRIGFSSSSAIGLAIALTLGGVSTVGAQQADTTHQVTKTTKVKVKKTISAKRIPVTKESPGEVAPPPAVNQDSIAAAERARQDSINAANERARQDSIARVEQMRRDSIAAAERRKQDSIAAAERARQDSIARADSIAAAERARISWMRKHGGWYMGVGGGVSIPTGNFSNAAFNSGGYSTGWNITVPIGYDFDKSILGFRLDGTFDQLNGREFNSNFSAPNLDVWGINLDARLRVPLGRTFSRFYVLGGGSWSDARGYFTDFSNPDAPTNKSSQSRWGWNAGGGFNFNWGYMVGLFVESRYIWINADNQSGFPFNSSQWVPIILGVTF